jgi:hypothetical protein
MSNAAAFVKASNQRKVPGATLIWLREAVIYPTYQIGFPGF